MGPTAPASIYEVPGTSVHDRRRGERGGAPNRAHVGRARADKTLMGSGWHRADESRFVQGSRHGHRPRPGRPSRLARAGRAGAGVRGPGHDGQDLHLPVRDRGDAPARHPPASPLPRSRHGRAGGDGDCGVPGGPGLPGPFRPAAPLVLRSDALPRHDSGQPGRLLRRPGRRCGVRRVLLLGRGGGLLLPAAGRRRTISRSPPPATGSPCLPSPRSSSRP